ncbi:13712_t:CDS:2, partial [Funneliformis mosseae]
KARLTIGQNAISSDKPIIPHQIYDEIMEYYMKDALTIMTTTYYPDSFGLVFRGSCDGMNSLINHSSGQTNI